MALVTWNPSDVGTDWVLSNANKTGTYGTGTQWESGRANIGNNAGKLYFEIQIDTEVNYYVIGVAVAGGDINQHIGNLGVSSGGDNVSQGGHFQEGAFSGIDGPTVVAANDIYGVAVDFGTNKVFVSVNNNFTLIVAGSDPVAETNPALTWTGSLTLFPCVSIFPVTSPPSSVTIFGNAGALTYSPPTGYSAWQSAISAGAAFRRTLSSLGTRTGSRQVVA